MFLGVVLLKMGTVKIIIELSQADYRLLENGARLLTDLDDKMRIYTPESFLFFAIRAGIENLSDRAKFNEN